MELKSDESVCIGRVGFFFFLSEAYLVIKRGKVDKEKNNTSINYVKDKKKINLRFSEINFISFNVQCDLYIKMCSKTKFYI